MRETIAISFRIVGNPKLNDGSQTVQKSPSRKSL